jgi:hypothetical protein
MTRPASGLPNAPTPGGNVPVSRQSSPKYCPVMVRTAPLATRVGRNFTDGATQLAVAGRGEASGTARTATAVIAIATKRLTQRFLTAIRQASS